MSDQAAREQADDRLSAPVAIVIAFATLVAAVAGLLQADASTRAGDLRDEAEQLSLQALAGSQAAQQAAQVELETFQLWIEQQTRAGNALLASLYAGSDPQRANALLREQERWEAIAAATLTLSDIDPEGEFGPERDPTFPSRYFARATQESLRLNALQDAADEEASAVDQRAASYTAVLAMLAVSLYLFGLTLAVVGRWLRLGFLSVGLTLLGVGSAWMVLTLIQPSHATDPETAAAYARARVASITAFDSAGYREAEANYDRAIELRPTFARAYLERSGVIFLGATPQRTGFVSIAPPEALQRARADLEQARALGLESAPIFGSLGFYGFAEGVQSGDTQLLAESAAYSRRAIALDPAEPIPHYNLGVALVAAGRFDEARAAYREAIERTLFVDEELTDLRQEPFIEEAWLAGALTDLEMVLRHRPHLDGEVRGFKEQLVGGVTSGSLEPGPASPATFADLELDIFPAQLQWQGNVTGYDAQRDVISAQWYQQGEAGLGWAVIPEVSLTQTPGTGTDGRLFQLSPYMTRVVPAECLPGGRYRAEIYINGRLAAQSEVEAPFGAFDAFMARDLTLAFCRPSDWQRRDDRLPGLIDGFVSADGQYGVIGARYSIPGSMHSLPDISAEIAHLTIDSFSAWFPATPDFDEVSGTMHEYFVGLSDTAWRWYDYGTGYVRVGAGLTDDGAVVIGMVFGPDDWFDGGEPYRILDSMIYVE